MKRVEKKDKGKTGKRIKKIELSVPSRILLYLCTVLFCALAVIGVVSSFLPLQIEYFCYAMAMILLLISPFYVKTDVIKLKRYIKNLIERHPLLTRLAENYDFRTLYFAAWLTLVSLLFSVMNGITGIETGSVWFQCVAVYYLLLSLLRVGVLLSARRIARLKTDHERARAEAILYRTYCCLMLIISLVLSGMTILLDESAGGKEYPGVLIYAVAAYTFGRIVLSIYHLIKTRKNHSFAVALIRTIGYMDACVSVLILQTAMFAAFYDDSSQSLDTKMNTAVGAIISLMILGIGIYGLIKERRGR